MCFIIPSNDRSGRGSIKQMLGLIHSANTSEEFWSASEGLEHPDTWFEHLKSRKSIKSFIYLVSIIYFGIPINCVCVCVCVCMCVRSVVSNSLWPHGLLPTRPLCPWNSLGKNTGVGCHFLLQGMFST